MILLITLMVIGVYFFINDDQKVYYSLFGDPIPNQVKEFIMKVDDRKILSSNFQIQDFNTDTCGLYCILILFLLSNKIKFEDIIIGFVYKWRPLVWET